MKRKYWFIALTISLLLFWGSTCRKKQDACPLNPENYELHHVSEKGFRHIFQIDITDGECSGCHHVVAEKCGLVSIKKKNTGEYGVFKATIETKDKTLPSCKKESTFFPKKWTVQTTLDKIEEAYQDVLKNRNKAYLFEDTVEQDEEDSYYDNNDDEEEDNYIYNHNLYKKKKRKTLIGKTSEGVRIKIILDKYNSDSIYNAYPVIESAKKPISVRRY